MPDHSDSVYTPSSLSQYSLGDRVKIRLAAFVFHFLIKAIGATLRFETRGLEHFDEVTRRGAVPIYAFWHDRIFAGTYFFRNRGIVVLTSQSFDGEYIARFIQRFGYGAVRGSSTRGGRRALVELIRTVREGLPVAFTVDGPRGPRYEAKAGPAALAQKTGAGIVPFVVEARKYWTVNSWDRMQIPRPFTRCLVNVHPAIYVSGQDDMETKRAEMQSSLETAVHEGEAWRLAKNSAANNT